MILMIRFLLFILLIIVIYWCFKYFLHPQRKLTQAIEQKRTLMMDDQGSVHRNLLLAYKGVLFEGEKYMGTAEDSFQIIKIHVWARDHQNLVGLQREDFGEIAKIIKYQYPFTEISWKSPIKELLR